MLRLELAIIARSSSVYCLIESTVSRWQQLRHKALLPPVLLFTVSLRREVCPFIISLVDYTYSLCNYSLHLCRRLFRALSFLDFGMGFLFYKYWLICRSWDFNGRQFWDTIFKLQVLRIVTQYIFINTRWNLVIAQSFILQLFLASYFYCRSCLLLSFTSIHGVILNIFHASCFTHIYSFHLFSPSSTQRPANSSIFTGHQFYYLQCNLGSSPPRISQRLYPRI